MSANEDQNPVALVHRWRACIDTQMHFNDMLLRTRSTGITLVIGVFGGAAVTLERFPENLTLAGTSIPMAAVVMFFGLLLLFSIFVLDYFYYFRMLLAAVEHTEEVEAASRRAGEPLEFFLTSAISRRVSRLRAMLVTLLFYGVPFVIGVVFMFYLTTIPAPAG